MELANRMGADVAARPSATPTLSKGTLDFARSQFLDNETGDPGLPVPTGVTD